MANSKQSRSSSNTQRADEVSVPVNVALSDKEKERILAEEAFWSAPKLISLCAVTLAISIAVLYGMASM